MKVNIDYLRVRICKNFDSLTKKLNSKINNFGEIEIDTSYIQNEMNTLHDLIGTLACVYSDGIMKEVYDEAFGEEGNMEHFNNDGL